MEGLYPSLNEKFRNEGICPICLMEMGVTPKYSCVNNHTVCYRCKPYYYSCPTCRSPLDRETSAEEANHYYMPPASQYLPQPYPPYPPSSEPTAPFIDHERQAWSYEAPTEDQELYSCQYSYLGCYAKIPQHLRNLHESRCQFRPNLENQHLPTDLTVDEGALQDCKYHVVGCNVRLSEWRKIVHEKLCIYKDKWEERSIEENLSSLNFDDTDPEEKVQCRFSRFGCMVMMPRRRKMLHEQKCNYLKYSRGEDDGEGVIFCVPESVEDPNEAVDCRWSVYGCQVQPKRYRKMNHEEKCNYRREPCRFSAFGCSEMVEPCKKHLHEGSCNYS